MFGFRIVVIVGIYVVSVSFDLRSESHAGTRGRMTEQGEEINIPLNAESKEEDAPETTKAEAPASG